MNREDEIAERYQGDADGYDMAVWDVSSQRQLVNDISWLCKVVRVSRQEFRDRFIDVWTMPHRALTEAEQMLREALEEK